MRLSKTLLALSYCQESLCSKSTVTKDFRLLLIACTQGDIQHCCEDEDIEAWQVVIETFLAGKGMTYINLDDVKGHRVKAILKLMFLNCRQHIS